MILGYDVYSEKLNINDYDDGVLLDDCVPTFTHSSSANISGLKYIQISNAIFDEFEVLKKQTQLNENTDNTTKWNNNTVMKAQFQESLSAGQISAGNAPITSIQFLRRRKSKGVPDVYNNDTLTSTNSDGEIGWQIIDEIECSGDSIENKEYEITDKFIASNQWYEYCVRAVSKIYHGNDKHIGDTVGMYSHPTEVYVKYDNAHLLGKDENNDDVSFDLIYNLTLGDTTVNIDANITPTLGGQYPFTTYGSANYKTSNISCLLVTEESATGQLNLGTEKVLRDKITKFLSNKKPKVLKCEDGTFLLINISDNFTLTPHESLLGSYTLSFNFVEIGDVNNLSLLKEYGLR